MKQIAVWFELTNHVRRDLDPNNCTSVQDVHLIALDEAVPWKDPFILLEVSREREGQTAPDNQHRQLGAESVRMQIGEESVREPLSQPRARPLGLGEVPV